MHNIHTFKKTYTLFFKANTFFVSFYITFTALFKNNETTLTRRVYFIRSNITASHIFLATFFIMQKPPHTLSMKRSVALFSIEK